MKKRSLLRSLGSIGIVIILFISSFGILPVAADNSQDEPVSAGVMNDDEHAAGSKISNSLARHVMKKIQAQSNPVDLSSSKADFSEMKIDGANIELTNTENVFLYFDQMPTDSQIAELESLGVRVYPDTWVPPVGNHPAGFVMAEMPLNQLEPVAKKNYLVRMDTAEKEFKPTNNLARAAVGVDSVWAGENTGAGVTVAVLDSGIDTSNLDLPALNSSNSKDYSNFSGTPGSLDDTLNNTFTGHGTHVAGSVLGRGVNSSTYTGIAPGADLVFLKIGNDYSGSATTQAIVGAITAAVDIYQADIITMSYGGWSAFHDGTDAECQAVDYAVNQGTTVFIAAGNEADEGWHYSGTVAANSTSAKIPIVVAENSYSYLYMGLVWYDGFGLNNQLRLEYYDSSDDSLSPTNYGQSESSRGTECIEYDLSSPVTSGTYYLKVHNLSSNSQFFHIYYYGYNGGNSVLKFSKPNPNYTLGSPAEADGAIAVGAYTTRTGWDNYLGDDPEYVYEKVGSIGTFSSQGPRVDVGAPQKPEIVAPGVGIISIRDNDVYPWPNYNPNAAAFPYDVFIIDNNGANLNGSGPADYFVMSGTSMACPIAAGVGALILSENPEYTPAQVKAALEFTATDKGTKGFDTIYGWGLINAAKSPYLSDIQITTRSLPDGDAKSAYPEQTIITADSVGTCKWSVKSGKLPKGLTLKANKTDSSKGVISGKPSVSGSLSFTIQVTDSTGAGSEQEYTININPALTLSAPKPSPGEVGMLFSTWTPIVSGGNSHYFWEITKGDLSELGLVLDNATGVISGTPSAAGSFNVTLKVTDTLGGSASKALSFKIYESVNILTTTLPSADIDIAYKSTTLKAGGGKKPYEWSIVNTITGGIDGGDLSILEGYNSLPPGLTFNKGVIKGTPQEGSSGTYVFSVQVTDGMQCTDTQELSIIINDPLAITDLPDGVVNEEYSHVLSAAGGSGGYKFSISKKELPSWLKFDTKTYTLSGTPIAADNYTIKNVKVTDSLKGTKTQDLTLVVDNVSHGGDGGAGGHVGSTKPTVKTVSPASNATGVAVNTQVTATFSKAMDASTISEDTFILKDPNQSEILTSVTYNSSSKTATLKPEANLDSNSVYTAIITTGVEDTDGKSLASEKTWSFTTTNADATPPQVESTSPSDKAGDIALNTTIYAVFSEDLDKSAINSNSFSLKKGGAPVNGAATYDDSSKIVTFTPTNNLTANTTYTATVTTAVTDSTGNHLAYDHTWSFTTSGSGKITSVNIIAPSIVAPGEEFTVGIQVNNVRDLVCYQFQVNYDNTTIELVDSQQYSGGIEDGIVGSGVFTPSWYNPDTGSIRWASISANEVPVNGDGYLARLHFKALKAGHSALVFTDVPRGSGQNPYGFNNKLFDHIGFDIPFDRTDGELTVNAS